MWGGVGGEQYTYHGINLPIRGSHSVPNLPHSGKQMSCKDCGWFQVHSI